MALIIAKKALLRNGQKSLIRAPIRTALRAAALYLWLAQPCPGKNCMTQIPLMSGENCCSDPGQPDLTDSLPVLVQTMKKLILPFCALFLASCGLNPPVESLTPEQRAKVSTITVHEDNPWPQARRLSSVSGLSCNRNKYQEPDIDASEAIQGVKMRAALVNADSVVNTLCQKNADTDYVHSCWTSVRCVGDAVKL